MPPRERPESARDGNDRGVRIQSCLPLGTEARRAPEAARAVPAPVQPVPVHPSIEATLCAPQRWDRLPLPTVEAGGPVPARARLTAADAAQVSGGRLVSGAAAVASPAPANDWVPRSAAKPAPASASARRSGVADKPAKGRLLALAERAIAARPEAERATAARPESEPAAARADAKVGPGPRPAPAAKPSVQQSSEAPAKPAKPAETEDRVGLFRKQAMDAHQGADTDERTMPTPTAGSWGLLAVLASLVALLSLGAALATVEVTVRAPATLRAPTGLRSVEAIISGSVQQVFVASGDRVEAGQLVARLEEARLQAAVELQERELQVLTTEVEKASQGDRVLLERTEQALTHRRSSHYRRADIKRKRTFQRLERLDRMRSLVAAGVASQEDELVARESLQAASEDVASLESDLADVDVTLAEARNAWQARELQRQASLDRGRSAVKEAKDLLAMTEIRAPAAGRVESLLVSAGSVVQPGGVLAQIVPLDAPRAIVAFLPTRETAFVQLGSMAKVEVESLPVGEFGMANAVVTRISSDIAKPEELNNVFGEVVAGSFVRVELDLADAGQNDVMAPHLRSGERLIVRLHRRQRRVISLMFDFVRKWVGQ